MRSRKATANQLDSMRRSAEARRCPKCQRKSALSARFVLDDGSARKCLFCGHECGILHGQPFGFKDQR